MSRFVISGRSSAAATATLPAVSLYATASGRPVIREIGVTNTTVTAFVAAINRLTTAGTQGSGLTEGKITDAAQTALGTGFNAHTGTPPTLGDELRRATIGAANGAGVVWVFGDRGLVIPDGTANGIGVLCPTGTGQVFDYWVEWEE